MHCTVIEGPCLFIDFYTLHKNLHYWRDGKRLPVTNVDVDVNLTGITKFK